MKFTFFWASFTLFATSFPLSAETFAQLCRSPSYTIVQKRAVGTSQARLTAIATDEDIAGSCANEELSQSTMSVEECINHYSALEQGALTINVAANCDEPSYVVFNGGILDADDYSCSGGGFHASEAIRHLCPSKVDITAPHRTNAIPEVNREAVEMALEFSREECARMSGDGDDALVVPHNSTYEMVIDDKGKTATVLYTDFKCGDVGPTWCGTGGCMTYVFVDGKAFDWGLSFPPYTFQISNPYNINTRTAVLTPRHGTYCRGARQERGYGSLGCYEISLWDAYNETFMTMSGAVNIFDPLGP